MTVVLCAETDTATIESVVGGLIRAWNDGDALEFASFFAEDGEMVNLHGMHLRGRQAIAGVYQLLFRSALFRSRISGEISSCRMLGKGVAQLHVPVTLGVSSGPKAGLHLVVCGLVLVRESAEWRVASLQSTWVTAPGA